MSDNKRIAKNTLFLYFRMIILMGVTLYTSRVVLDKLGVDDYGLYQVVGGVVAMLSFINSTLSIGTSRFITFELGRKNESRLHETFVTSFYSHLILGLILVIILETIGLWFVYNKLVIPPDRLNAAVIAYHISVFASLVSITQVPYTSLIMAHERMGVYAYISILEAIASLLVVYLLSISHYDKLIIYTILIAIVKCFTMFLYRIYCSRKFLETRLKLIFNIEIFKSLMSFSGWNIMANLAEMLKMQGSIVLLNLFFQPVVVTAQSIGNQVAGAIMVFVGSFRNAINPQIIKLYAAGDYEGSKRLTLDSTVLVFDLVLLLGLPSIFVMDTIMKIWLIDVPPYAIVFTQFIIIQRILGTFDSAYYIPMMAAGKVKTNSIMASLFSPATFVILYFVFKLGGNVMWLQYISLIGITIFGFIVKPYILVYDNVKGYNYKDFFICTLNCFKVAIFSVILSYVAYLVIGNSSILSSVLLFFVSLTSVVVASYAFLNSYIKKQIKDSVYLYLRKY